MIKQASLQDVELVAPLFDLYRQFYKQESNVAAVTEFLTERLQKKDSVIFLAMNGSTAVGFTQLYPSFSSVSMRRLWILNDLFVLENSRRHKVAQKLIEQSEAYALSTHSKGLTLKTAMTNMPAQKLYELLGWKKDVDFYSYNKNVMPTKN